MEPSNNLLEKILENEILDNLIHTTKCLPTLNFLLQVKHQRKLGGHCVEIPIFINIILNSETDVDLGAQILKNSLLIASNNNEILSETKAFCLRKVDSNQNSVEIYYCFNLLNVIFEYYKDKKLELKDIELCNGIVNALNTSSRPLIILIATDLLPNYFSVCCQNDKESLLKSLFKFIQKSNKLEFLCVLWSHFVSSDFNLLKCDEFWKLIIENITNQNYLQKQAIYLLSKSTEVVFEPSSIPDFLKVQNQAEFSKTWRDYFILLDVSNEKQLHFIEPSLHMLSSIRNLHISWRLSLYKILLQHSQNLVVYEVVNFILENENDFSQILQDLFSAVNKNNYNEESQKIFQKIGFYCSKIQKNEFDFFLNESLNVAWTPASVWGLYSNIFSKSNTEISFELFLSIAKKLKLVPHKFIRESCTRIVLKYFTQNCTVKSLDELLKILSVLWNFNEDLFYCFIQNNSQLIIKWEIELFNNFQTSIDNCCEDEVEIQIKIFQILKLEIPTISVFKINDSICYFLLQYINSIDLENYVLNRIEHVAENENISVLLKIILKFSTPKLCEKAADILAGHEFHNKRIISFGILYKSGNFSLKSVINFWRSMTIDEDIMNFFVEILLDFLRCNNVSNSDEIEQTVILLQRALDGQSKATITILQNIAVILKYSNYEFVSNFICLCMDEFLNLYKSSNFKTIANTFLVQLFQLEGQLSYKIFEFTKKLLQVSNSANSITYLLSKIIRDFCQQNPEKGLMFLPIIVELVLSGIIINKNER